LRDKNLRAQSGLPADGTKDVELELVPPPSGGFSALSQSNGSKENVFGTDTPRLNIEQSDRINQLTEAIAALLVENPKGRADFFPESRKSARERPGMTNLSAQIN
jgi:hypothetical protein